MTASAQRPCVLQEVFAVKGGGIDPSAADCSGAWILKPTIVDGKQCGGHLYWELPLQAIRGQEFQNGGSQTKYQK